MHVANSLEEPATVKLPQGTYLIIAEISEDKIESIKVVIEGGKTTEVEKEEWIN